MKCRQPSYYFTVKRVNLFTNHFSLVNYVINKLNSYINQLPKTTDWDMLFIGDGCGLHIENKYIKPVVYIYKKSGDSISRCTDSYLVSKKGAKKICNYINDNSNN